MLGYASPEELLQISSKTAEIARLLNGLIKALRPSDKAP
jgi:hypothetical protein